MTTRHSSALWEGTLKEGKGTMSFSNYHGPFTFSSRFEEGEGTNPEELVGAAISGCFSMFLASLISNEGFEPKSIQSKAEVNLEKDNIGPLITLITINCSVSCDSIPQEVFDNLVIESKKKCPISRLYSGGSAQINVKANLVRLD